MASNCHKRHWDEATKMDSFFRITGRPLKCVIDDAEGEAGFIINFVTELNN
jgi:hypothetical protein